MPKNDNSERLQNEIDEINKWKRQKEIDEAVKAGVDEYKRNVFKWGIRICLPATSAILIAIYNMGILVYQHWQGFQAAIDAWILATTGGSK